MGSDSYSLRAITEVGRSGVNRKGEPEFIWNLWVQILLPLIMILTFLAVLEVLKHENITRVTEDRLANCIEEQVASQDSAGVQTKYEVALLLLQQQKLITALSEVELQERDALKLARFQSGQDVKMETVRIVDENFRVMCVSVEEKVFSNNSKMQDYRGFLYDRVLKEAEIKDLYPPIPVLRRREEGYSRKELVTSGEGTISNSNRIFIHNRIVEFVNDMEAQVVELQGQVLKRIFDELLDHPEDLDRKSKQLVGIILDPNSALEEKTTAANEFFAREMSRVKKKVEDYHFLDKTWNQIAALV